MPSLLVICIFQWGYMFTYNLLKGTLETSTEIFVLGLSSIVVTFIKNDDRLVVITMLM